METNVNVDSIPDIPQNIPDGGEVIEEYVDDAGDNKKYITVLLLVSIGLYMIGNTVFNLSNYNAVKQMNKEKDKK